MSTDARRSFADAEPRPFWLAQPDAPDAGAAARRRRGGRPARDRRRPHRAVGRAARERARADVVLLEGERIAFGASGRNGGFMDASLTHGIENGVARWPDEMPELERLGRENFARDQARRSRATASTPRFEETGELAFATAPYQAEYIPEVVETARAYGWPAEALERRAGAGGGALAHLPRRRLRAATGAALVDPARLAWGLAGRGSSAGARIYERSPVARAAQRDGAGVRATTARGRVGARPPRGAGHQRLPAARARDPALRRAGLRLRARHRAARRREQRDVARLGAAPGADRPRQPVPLLPADRATTGSCSAATTRSTTSATAWARTWTSARPRSSCWPTHFFATFPQLEGLRFTHRWGGAIDTCSRFSVMFGKALGGRAVFAVGYTGLGVGGEPLRRAGRARPGRGPRHRAHPPGAWSRSQADPVPARAAALGRDHADPARPGAADRREGRRGPWLRLLDRLGMGFDS